MTQLLKLLALVGIFALPFAGVAGCEEKGAFEEAGEDIDDAADDVGDNLEDAGDDMEDAVDDLDDNR